MSPVLLLWIHVWCLGAGDGVRQTGDVNGGTHDPELADDLVGVASARLLALGTSRSERVGALRLLSVLATLADADDRVRRPLAMVASEFDLPADDVELWLDDLVAVEVVRLEGSTIVLGGREPAGVGISLHDFLDAAAELDERTDDRPVRPAADRHLAPLRRPAGAVLAAVALVTLALLAPGVLRDEGTTVSSSRTPPAPEVPATAGDATAAPTTVGPQPAPEPPAPEPPAAQAEPVEPVEPVEGGERVGPVVVSTTSTTLLPCPSGVPALEVLGSTSALDGSLAVDGVARNHSAQPLRINTFVLRTTVAGREVTVPGLLRPLVVPPGGEVLWQSLLPVLAPPGTSVRVTLGDWEWLGLDDGLVCPTP